MWLESQTRDGVVDMQRIVTVMWLVHIVRILTSAQVEESDCTIRVAGRQEFVLEIKSAAGDRQVIWLLYHEYDLQMQR